MAQSQTFTRTVVGPSTVSKTTTYETRSSYGTELGSGSGSTYRASIAPRNLIIQRSSGLGPAGGGSSRTMTVERSYQLGAGIPAGAYANVTNTGVTAVKNSREREKKDMQDLNERFASYIEKVRFLEAQNRRLADELEKLKSKWGKETTAIKAMYQAELDEARKLLDDADKEKARLEIRVASLEEQLEEHRQRAKMVSREGPLGTLARQYDDVDPFSNLDFNISYRSPDENKFILKSVDEYVAFSTEEQLQKTTSCRSGSALSDHQLVYTFCVLVAFQMIGGGAGSCLNLVASNTPLIVGKPVALSSSGCPDGGDCRWDFCDQTDGQCVTVCDGKSCKDSRYWFDEAYDLCFIIGNNTAGCYCLIDHHTNNDVQCFEVIIQTAEPLKSGATADNYSTGLLTGHVKSDATALSISIGLLIGYAICVFCHAFYQG